MTKDGVSVDGRSFGSWDDIISETILTDSHENDSDERIDNVGKRETRHLELFKSIFLCLLLLATVVISWTVYTIAESGEESQFETHFQDQSNRLLQEFSLRFANAIGALHSFDVAITSHVDSTSLKWPYAFVPEFDIRAESILAISNAKFLSFLVKVTSEEERTNFESYVQDNTLWVEQASARLKEGHHHRQLQEGTNGSLGSGIPTFNLTMGTFGNGDDTMGNTTNGHGNSTTVGNTTTGHENDGTSMGNSTNTTNNNNNDDSSGGTVDKFQNTTDDEPGGKKNVTEYNNNASMGVIFPTLFAFQEDNHRITESVKSEYYPVFQCHPVNPNLINYNVMSRPLFGEEIERSSTSRSIVVGKMVLPRARLRADVETSRSSSSSSNNNEANGNNNNIYNHSSTSQIIAQEENNRRLVNDWTADSSTQGLYQKVDPYIGFIHKLQPNSGPFSQVILPIFDNFSSSGDTSTMVVGFLSGYLFWSDFISAQLPETVHQVICVLQNDCGQVVSYEVNSKQKPKFLGEGDFHNPEYDKLGTSFRMEDIVKDGTQQGIFFSSDKNDMEIDLGYCPYTIKIYPSEMMDEGFETSRPLLYMFLVMSMFIVTCCTFFGYDFLHERRNKVVMATARQTQKIVSSLFPAIVRDRLFEDVGEVFQRGVAVPSTPRVMLRSYLNEGEENEEPIADLFPDTTIMFADISGFTAWSSLREPAQVFTLLETIYSEFDKLAKKQQVFKVETIGDCYVAVAGLPDPQPDHANIMAKFANHCLNKFSATVKNLETTLGPDTSDLGLRVGLHSGPVTAGVLRGEKSRFQLFGDTMNTASRMESTSKTGRIQCSTATAILLREAGCGDVLVPRSTTVEIKGKGVKQTYWIKLTRSPESGNPVLKKSLSEPKLAPPDLSIIKNETLPRYIRHPSKIVKTLQDNQRLIDWHVEMLSRLLRQIVGSRKKKDRIQNRRRSASIVSNQIEFLETPMEELTEIVEMPQFDKKKAKNLAQLSSSTELPPEVQKQLRVCISTLACMYKGDNPFHNFAHASHVTMASNKLLSRVVAPDDSLIEDSKRVPKGFAMKLHDYTYGLTSDPLTQFAIVFSALIHDVDHRGVSNSQLVKEETEEAQKYEGKSVAEQHSIEVAWQVLMDPALETLRSCIYATDDEYQRFRQLVVNCVIATDIFDKNLKDLRNRRWDLAFHTLVDTEDEDDNFNRKATIVIEHIIQAADVSHTMQHWLVYQKWNERLFAEMYKAYLAGRGGDKDPSIGWYNGELWFFDNYVIPLAKKLEECGVFGVSSAECLDYAKENREQWEKKGPEIVEGLRNKYCRKREDMEASTRSLKLLNS